MAGKNFPQECLKGLMQTAYSFAPPHMNRQRAASIAALGCIYWKEGRAVKAGEHIPVYLRQSQAERDAPDFQGKCLYPKFPALCQNGVQQHSCHSFAAKGLLHGHIGGTG